MKYCKYCGRQLQDHEFCNCPDTVKNNPMTTIVPTSEKEQTNTTDDECGATNEIPYQSESVPFTFEKKQSVFTTAIKNIIPYLKAFIKSPANTLHTSAQNTDLPLAGIFYGFYVISVIMFDMILVSKLVTIIRNISNVYTSMVYSYGSSQITISYTYAFVCGLLIAFLIITLTNVCMFLLGLISHSKYNFKQIVAATAGIFVLPSFCLLFAFILFFISITLSLGVMIVGVASYILLFFYTAKTLFKRSDNGLFLWVLIGASSILFMITAYVTVNVPLSFSSNIIRVDNSIQSKIENYPGEDYNPNDYYDDYFDDYDNYYGFYGE